MKKVLFILLLIIIGQIFTAFQLRNVDKVSTDDIKLAVKAHNIAHYIGE